MALLTVFDAGLGEDGDGGGGGQRLEGVDPLAVLSRAEAQFLGLVEGAAYGPVPGDRGDVEESRLPGERERACGQLAQQLQRPRRPGTPAERPFVMAEQQ
ncbi:hypothetical protein [Streptomyces sp. LN785]|uniref:hypothetical protein n=1 Tax=Streptomyces sp. LN785 TaxID=3112983 RepID=UPI003724154B